MGGSRFSGPEDRHHVPRGLALGGEPDRQGNELLASHFGAPATNCRAVAGHIQPTLRRDRSSTTSTTSPHDLRSTRHHADLGGQWHQTGHPRGSHGYTSTTPSRLPAAYQYFEIWRAVDLPHGDRLDVCPRMPCIQRPCRVRSVASHVYCGSSTPLAGLVPAPSAGGHPAKVPQRGTFRYRRPDKVYPVG